MLDIGNLEKGKGSPIKAAAQFLILATSMERGQVLIDICNFDVKGAPGGSAHLKLVAILKNLFTEMADYLL